MDSNALAQLITPTAFAAGSAMVSSIYQISIKDAKALFFDPLTPVLAAFHEGELHCRHSPSDKHQSYTCHLLSQYVINIVLPQAFLSDQSNVYYIQKQPGNQSIARVRSPEHSFLIAPTLAANSNQAAPISLSNPSISGD